MKFFVDWAWGWPDMQLGVAIHYEAPSSLGSIPPLVYLLVGLGPIQVGAGFAFGREIMG